MTLTSVDIPTYAELDGESVQVCSSCLAVVLDRASVLDPLCGECRANAEQADDERRAAHGN